MKAKTLLFALVLITSTLSATTPLLISEDFASAAWQAEFLKQNPGDPNAAPPVLPFALSATNYGLNSVNLYFDKYKFNGAVLTDGGVAPFMVTCADALANPTNGIVHKEEVTGLPVAFRFKSSGTAGTTGTFMEFPELPNAGVITVHARSGNGTAGTNLYVQQFDASTSTWTSIATLALRPYNDVIINSIDEIVTYNINSPSTIKLRLFGGSKFTYMYRVDVAAYEATGLNTVKVSSFKLAGRTLTTSQPVAISLYNSLGAKVFEKSVQNEVVLPASIGKGIFFVKSELGSQKIFLN